MKDLPKTPKPSGRPRQFDADEALEKAMRLFWAKGYDGVSIGDLTKVMGVNRPSLYATFGNKEELFKKALARYMHCYFSSASFAAQFTTVHASVEAMLHAAADFLANTSHPPGCFEVVVALAGGDESKSVLKKLQGVRTGGIEAWRDRFARAQAEGEIPASPTAIDLARYVMTVVTGMTVIARTGATAEDLHRVADIAVKSLPLASSTNSRDAPPPKRRRR
jgi:AcrR family transcriptional regulator